VLSSLKKIKRIFSGWKENSENPVYFIAAGAKHFTKRLPPEKLLEIITQTKDKIVLLGGKEDSLIATLLSQKCEENTINLCGTLSLHESAFMIKHAKAVITHDTGLMHIAAAFQKRIISVWGGTVPELGMTPWMPQHPQFSTIVEVNDLACRP
jgi:ADP-heptose:LPS heptosyltransferase